MGFPAGTKVQWARLTADGSRMARGVVIVEATGVYDWIMVCDERTRLCEAVPARELELDTGGAENMRHGDYVEIATNDGYRRLVIVSRPIVTYDVRIEYPDGGMRVEQWSADRIKDAVAHAKHYRMVDEQRARQAQAQEKIDE